jgi:hypothetical protein
MIRFMFELERNKSPSGEWERGGVGGCEGEGEGMCVCVFVCLCVTQALPPDGWGVCVWRRGVEALSQGDWNGEGCNDGALPPYESDGGGE